MIYDAEPQFIAKRADLIDFIRRRLSVEPGQLRQDADELLPTVEPGQLRQDADELLPTL